MGSSLSYRLSAVALAAGLFLTVSQTAVAAGHTPSTTLENDRAKGEIPQSWDAASSSPGLAVSTSQPLKGGAVAYDEHPAKTDETAAGASVSRPNGSEGDTKVQPAIERAAKAKRADFNQDIFYAKKIELSQEVGWLPINVPCPFNFLMGDPYVLYPLKYTLVPIITSLRWQLDDLDGLWFLRGNWELDTSFAAVAIPRGAETRYFAWIMGMRRNFVPRNWRATPYWDWRIGLGTTNAKGPLGVAYSQGENFTFTLNMGSGVRYNFGPRYGIAAGLNWMHISNANLSQGAVAHTGIRNVGINVYGPVIGIDYQLRRRARHSE